MIHLGDITKISGYDVPPVNIITGGSPCQDLSVAGKRAGLAGERSGLFMEQIRIIKEMREKDARDGRTNEHIRPRFMVWENVPGAFSSNGGEDFRAVLEETAKIVCEDAVIPRPAKGKWTPSGCIMGDGWSIAWRVHDAQFWGVPQRRKRIALVADFAGGGAPEILFERKSVSRDTQPSRQEGQGVAGCVKADIGATGFDAYNQQPTGNVSKPLNNAATDSDHVPCVAYGLDSYNQTACEEVVENIRSADGGDSKPKVCVYTLNGKATTPPLDAHYYLGAGARSGVEREAVLCCGDAKCIGNGQTAQTGLSDKVGALNCMHDQQAVITYGIDRASFNQGQNAQYNFSIEEEKAQTAKGPGAVCKNGGIYAGTQNKILCLLSETYGEETVEKWGIAILAALQSSEILQSGVHESSVSSETKNGEELDGSTLPCPSVVTGWLLRDMRKQQECGCSPHRRQSTEQQPEKSEKGMSELSQQNSQTCKEMFDMWEKGEGLGLLRQTLSEIQEVRQSFNGKGQSVHGCSIVRRLTPLEAERLQGYPDRWTDIGDWVDSKGKKHKGESDSPRYKALGNSIALPFWEWMAERMLKVLNEDKPTMASLFDGIGGFPLVYSRHGCEPVWASEIEEFPIAVTKRRFGDDNTDGE